MYHLYRYKPRLVVLGPKIEELPDAHPSKARCLRALSLLFGSVGNPAEQKRLLTHSLKLWRERGDDDEVAITLRSLSEANRQMELYEEGIRQAKEASEIFERLGGTASQAHTLIILAWLLHDDQQLDAAEEAASHAIDLSENKQFDVCNCHRILGRIYYSKSEEEKAKSHFEAALGIASSFGWHGELFSIHYDLARLFFDQDRFDDAQAHVELIKSHVINDTYKLGCAMELQALLWCIQGRLEEAKIEVLRAVEVFEKLGAARNAENCREILQGIDEETNGSVVSDESDDDGEFLETVLPLVFINFLRPDWVTESE